jgi:phosphate transport system protein
VISVPPTELQLQTLRDKVLLLGGQSETALSLATRALIQRDSGLAQQVIAEDDEIDLVESEIDALCVEILGGRHLTSEDLRFVVGIVRTTPMIERIADHSVNIARHSLRLNDEPELKTQPDLPRMVDIVRTMLADSLDALTTRDSQKARSIIRRDDEADFFYRRIFNDLMACMKTDLTAVGRATELLFVVKHLERIADYVTNICEQVVYLVEGHVIKHSPEVWLQE